MNYNGITDESRKNYEEVMAIRFYMYNLFVRIFDRPADEALVESLKGETPWECLQALAFDQGGRMRKGASFFNSLRRREAAPLLKQLQDEYARLFPEETGPSEQPDLQNGARPFRLPPKIQKFRQKWFPLFGIYAPTIQNSLSNHLNAMADLCQDALSEFQKGNFKKAEKFLLTQRELLEKELPPLISKIRHQMTGVPECELYSEFVAVLESFLQGELPQIDGLAAIFL